MAFIRHNNSNNGRRHNNHQNRHRHHNTGNTPNGQQGQQRRFVNRINQVFESVGPDGRIRGTVQQIAEKYTALARDASTGGDRVLMMNYWQHAEHYQRLLTEILEENAANEREREATRISANPQPMTDENGDVLESPEGDLSIAPQPSTQNYDPQQPRPQQRHESRQDTRHEPRDRQPRHARPEQRQDQRQEQRQDTRHDTRSESHQNGADEGLDSLPSFLQPPPAPRSARQPAVEVSAPIETLTETPNKAPNDGPVAVQRATRTRRASPAKTAETDGTDQV
jgi:hypothetical protein